MINKTRDIMQAWFGYSYYQWFLLLLLAATVTSCTRFTHLHYGEGETPGTPTPETPGNPDQPHNVTLQFKLHVTAEAGSQDNLLDEMEEFILFLFDADGGYLLQTNVSNEFLQTHDNMVTLAVDPGSYQLVCWGNTRTYSTITNLNAGMLLNEATIVHTATQDQTTAVVVNGDPLYFAPRSGNTTRAATDGAYVFDVPNEGSVNAEIEFTPAHKKLRIYVKDFKGTDENGTTDCPVINVGTLACGYNLLMQPIQGAQLEYRNRATPQTDTPGATPCPAVEFNTPLFTYNDQLTIDVMNPADLTVRYSLNLIEELKKQNINPADENIRDIRVDIDFVDTFDASVAITIPDWYEKPVEPGLN